MKVCFFASSRADLGHLQPLIDESQANSEIQPILLALDVETRTNSNNMAQLLDDSGGIKKIVLKNEGLDSEEVSYNTEIFASVFINTSKILQVEKPSVVVVLGDRLETLAFASVAFLLKIKVCHLHGGEISKGSLDDVFRNQISALASIHFPATRDAVNRLIRMGFDSSRIFSFGALAVDSIACIVEKNDNSIVKQLGLSPLEYVLCTYHPATQLEDNGLSEVIQLLRLLEQIELPIIFTRVNTEVGSEKIELKIKNFVQSDPRKRIYLGNLGSHRYINLMRNCKFVIGNSSSGIFEAPILGVPSINFGRRQEGRWKPSTVIQIETFSDLNDFVKSLEVNPRNNPSHAYGEPGVAKKVLRAIKDSCE